MCTRQPSRYQKCLFSSDRMRHCHLSIEKMLSPLLSEMSTEWRHNPTSLATSLIDCRISLAALQVHVTGGGPVGWRGSWPEAGPYQVPRHHHHHLLRLHDILQKYISPLFCSLARPQLSSPFLSIAGYCSAGICSHCPLPSSRERTPQIRLSTGFR